MSIRDKVIAAAAVVCMRMEGNKICVNESCTSYLALRPNMIYGDAISLNKMEQYYYDDKAVPNVMRFINEHKDKE